LLRDCRYLRILVTSRQSLGITDGENIRIVPALTQPETEYVPSHAVSPVSDLLQYEATQLFVNRAHAAAGFQLTASNASSVAQIGSRLDGIPLAIELAAVRVRSLPIEQIVARLNDRF